MLNKIALVGRLTKDPEVRYTSDNQTAIARFTLAVGRIFEKEGQPTADFIPITVFGRSAENCGKYIKKGRLVAVSGRIQTRNWDDQEGKRHFATEVIADEVDFLDKGPGEIKDNSSVSQMTSDDDLPF